MRDNRYEASVVFYRFHASTQCPGWICNRLDVHLWESAKVCVCPFCMQWIGFLQSWRSRNQTWSCLLFAECRLHDNNLLIMKYALSCLHEQASARCRVVALIEGIPLPCGCGILFSTYMSFRNPAINCVMVYSDKKATDSEADESVCLVYHCFPSMAVRSNGSYLH